MKKVALVVAALFVLFGCGAKEYEESEQAHAVLSKDTDAAGAVTAVREYNRNVIQAYLKNDPAPVKELADNREYQKLEHMIQGMQAQSLRLESKLESLKVEKIDRWGQNNIMVTTVERWRYRRVNTASGAEVKPYTDIEYHMNYNMIRPKGRWILFELTPA